MSSKKKKILFRLIVLSVLMCVVLPLSVHAALVIGNEFGFGTYVAIGKAKLTPLLPWLFNGLHPVRRANKCVYNTFHR